MFVTGSYVVYGVNGVCKVVEITSFCAPGSDEEKDYYVLEPLGKSGSKVFVPVGGNKVALRRIMTEQEARDLIASIPDVEPLDIPNDKHREEAYKKAMATCDYREWIRIIKTLYSRRQERLEQGKAATAMDTRYWKSAEQYLYSELALALSEDAADMEEYITRSIEGK